VNLLGKLIVLEGLDGSGKSTQLDMLVENLSGLDVNFKTVSFPEYAEPSCEPVKMYLSGRFGDRPDDVNAYAASLFFAVDRYASYKLKWGELYNSGGLVIAGRYFTSNAIHQTSKLPESEWDSYLDWLYDLEINRVAIPKPDRVIFLDMPVEIANRLVSKRYGGDEAKKDIHEKDSDYLKMCRKAALYAGKKFSWDIVDCAEGGEPKKREEISDIILNLVKEVI